MPALLTRMSSTPNSDSIHFAACRCRGLVGDVELDEPGVGTAGPQLLLGLAAPAGVPGTHEHGHAAGAEQPGGFEADALVGTGNQRSRCHGPILGPYPARRESPAEAGTSSPTLRGPLYPGPGQRRGRPGVGGRLISRYLGSFALFGYGEVSRRRTREACQHGRRPARWISRAGGRTHAECRSLALKSRKDKEWRLTSPTAARGPASPQPAPAGTWATCPSCNMERKVIDGAHGPAPPLVGAGADDARLPWLSGQHDDHLLRVGPAGV